MDNLQIDYVLNSTSVTKHKYVGCFNIALLNVNNMQNGIYIVNTEKNVHIMGHWILLYVKKHCVIYFDSFGMLPSHYGGNIEKCYHSFNCKRIINKSPIQYKYSLLCGAYCIYVAYHLCRNISYVNILSKISSKNRIKNDIVIEDFLFRVLKMSNICNRRLCGTVTFKSHCRLKCECNNNNNTSTI